MKMFALYLVCVACWNGFQIQSGRPGVHEEQACKALN